MDSIHYCYILYNQNRTYVGYTIEPLRRIKQHNGILKGGAKATSKKSGWEFLAILTSPSEDWNKNLALSMEWHLKHPKGRKFNLLYSGIEGKIRSLREVLGRFAGLLPFTIYMNPKHIPLLENDLLHAEFFPLESFKG